MGFALTIRPLLIIAVFLFLMGLLVFLIGLLAELVLRSATLESGYLVREVIEGKSKSDRLAEQQRAAMAQMSSRT
jgi:uncharacterized membrane protein YiaA